MLQKALARLLELRFDHKVEYVGHCKIPLRLHTQVFEAFLVHENFLDNKRGDRLGQLGPPLHNPQAQWDNLRLNQEVDHFGIVNLDQRANHSQRR